MVSSQPEEHCQRNKCDHDSIQMPGIADFPDQQRTPGVQQHLFAGPADADKQQAHGSDGDTFKGKHGDLHHPHRRRDQCGDEVDHLGDGRIDGAGIVTAIDVVVNLLVGDT